MIGGNLTGPELGRRDITEVWGDSQLCLRWGRGRGIWAAQGGSPSPGNRDTKPLALRSPPGAKTDFWSPKRCLLAALEAVSPRAAGWPLFIGEVQPAYLEVESHRSISATGATDTNHSRCLLNHLFLNNLCFLYHRTSEPEPSVLCSPRFCPRSRWTGPNVGSSVHRLVKFREGDRTGQMQTLSRPFSRRQGGPGTHIWGSPPAPMGASPSAATRSDSISQALSHPRPPHKLCGCTEPL